MFSRVRTLLGKPSEGINRSISSVFSSEGDWGGRKEQEIGLTQKHMGGWGAGCKTHLLEEFIKKCQKHIRSEPKNSQLVPLLSVLLIFHQAILILAHKHTIYCAKTTFQHIGDGSFTRNAFPFSLVKLPSPMCENVGFVQ